MISDKTGPLPIKDGPRGKKETGAEGEGVLEMLCDQFESWTRPIDSAEFFELGCVPPTPLPTLGRRYSRDLLEDVGRSIVR